MEHEINVEFVHTISIKSATSAAADPLSPPSDSRSPSPRNVSNFSNQVGEPASASLNSTKEEGKIIGPELADPSSG